MNPDLPPKGWCYLCHSEHPYHEPCTRLEEWRLSIGLPPLLDVDIFDLTSIDPKRTAPVERTRRKRNALVPLMPEQHPNVELSRKA